MLRPQTLWSWGRSRECTIRGRAGKAGICRGSPWTGREQSAAVCGAREGLLEEARSQLTGRGRGACLGRRLSVWEGQEKQEASRGTEGPASLQSGESGTRDLEKVAREPQ